MKLIRIDGQEYWTELERLPLKEFRALFEIPEEKVLILQDLFVFKELKEDEEIILYHGMILTTRDRET